MVARPSRARAKPRSLYDEQPVVVELFELLWKSGARVPIPDTLVYKFGRLDAWFFVSKSGQLKQKKNQTVVSQNVFDKVRAAFCDGLRHANDIAAVWAGGAPGATKAGLGLCCADNE